MTVFPGTPSYASWGARVGAYLIDSLIAGVPYLIFVGIGAAIGGSFGTVLTVVGALLAFGISVYNRWILAGQTGQSYGRKALGIRLVGEQTGQPIGGGMAFVRDIAHFVDSLICYIGWLFPLWDDKKQTIGDKIVKTVVVQP
jgi:uncharacterized RDD family membrane protein YckC